MKHSEDSHKIIDNNNYSNLKMVVLETRFVSKDIKTMIMYRKFTLACIRGCLKRGEALYASHMMFAETNTLDEFSAEELTLGMVAGFLWSNQATKTVVYTDLGIGKGIAKGIETAKLNSKEIEYKTLGWIPTVEQSEVDFEIKLREIKKEVFNEVKSLTGDLKLSNLLIQKKQTI